MSYDIHFYKARPGHTASDAHDEQFGRDGSEDLTPPRTHLPLSASERDALAEKVAAAIPGCEVSRPASADPIQILSAGNESPWDFCISEWTSSLSWTYTKSAPELRSVVERVRPGVAVLIHQGFRGFDPQLDRDFDPENDWDHIAAPYQQVNRHLARSVAKGGVWPTRPWWKFWA